jgi:hypothetical protein
MLREGELIVFGSKRTLSTANETRDTGTGVTETVPEPVLPSLEAEMVTVTGLPPRFMPAVTPPVAVTAAAATSDDVHETNRPVNTCPLPSKVVATSVVIAPLAIVIAVGETETDATAAGSVGLEQERRAQAIAGINR